MISTAFEQVMRLQLQYSPSKTPPMAERGKYIKQDIPGWLAAHAEIFNPDDLIPDLAIEGQDGIGNKSKIPWVRIFSRSKSPKAPNGWYVVFLFSDDGKRCYLTLGHGSTKPSSKFELTGTMIPRSDEEMAQLVTWGRSKLIDAELRNPRLQRISNLTENPNSLGAAYQKSALYSFEYSLSDFPNDTLLTEDLIVLVDFLAKLYQADATDLAIPGKPSQELEAINQTILEASGNARYTKRTGRNRLSPKENKAIELYAVSLAINHFKEQGWTEVLDVGEKKSYDVHCEKNGRVLFVEVKGTTSFGNSVVLTRNEVSLHKNEFPNNALFLVSQISLTRGEEPEASGGVIRVIEPWKIEDSSLDPIAYDYAIPESRTSD